MGFRSGIGLAAAAAVAAALAAAVVAAGGSEAERNAAAEARPRDGCPVTQAGRRPAPGRERGRLWVEFGPSGGIYRVPPFNVGRDGSLGVKFAWQRGPGVRGAVTVEARRLDGRAPRVRRRIPTRGYGPTGLLASGIAFPTPGCWKVTASADGASLTFVLLLRAPVIVGCDSRSMANFPGGFTSPRNLVVGPMAMQGAGEPTPASVVREFGGNKFPMLVRAGHSVTVRISGEARKVGGLFYADMGGRPLPDGEVKLRHTADEMTFVACGRGRRSGSRADGEAVTFWSGFVVLDRPACVTLEVDVDREPTARHAVIEMGRRCG